MILETKRLTVRSFALCDADFILRLLNEPSYIENIADKRVRNLNDARRYLRQVPMASYKRHGFGLWRVGLKDSDVSIGMAGLLKREILEGVDIGYAFLPEYCGCGYGYEVTSAVMTYATGQLGYCKVLAVVNEGNEPSLRLLGKLGFKYKRRIRLADGEEEMQLFESVMLENRKSINKSQAILGFNSIENLCNK